MAWIDILPSARGPQSAGSGPRVTVGRRVSKNGSTGLVVGISGPLLAELGWPQKGALRVQHDPEKGLLRLSEGGQVKTRSTGEKSKGASLGFAWERSTEGKRAELAPHIVEDSAVIITLPSWAAPQRAGFAGAQAAADAARARLMAPANGKQPHVPVSGRVFDAATQGGRRG